MSRFYAMGLLQAINVHDIEYADYLLKIFQQVIIVFTLFVRNLICTAKRTSHLLKNTDAEIYFSVR